MKRRSWIAIILVCCLMLSGCSMPFQAADAAAAGSVTEEEQVNTFGTDETYSAVPEHSVVTELPEEASGHEEQAPEAAEQASSAEAAASSAEEAAPAKNEAQDSELEEKLDSMTLEEKAAQLFFITPEALTGVSAATQAGDLTKAAFDETPVGGIIYFAQNLEDETQVTAMLSDMQTISRERTGLPVFTGVDEEGGTVTRISGTGRFDVPDIADMSEIGATGSTDTAFEIGEQIGTYLSRMGFNLDFAPDADVLSNPDNTVVKQRSFGSDPETVASMALAVAEGLNSCGVLACCKHFPGHGATEGDTHEGYAYTSKTIDELEACELIPFEDWIKNDAGMIMVGHISLPNAITEDTPASLSSEIITDLLRNQMGYQGVVITDALNMGAITESYTSAEAAVAALLAGADMLLTPESFEEAYQGVLDAVEQGTLTEERIDESVLRILKLKASLTE